MKPRYWSLPGKGTDLAAGRDWLAPGAGEVLQAVFQGGEVQSAGLRLGGCRLADEGEYPAGRAGTDDQRIEFLRCPGADADDDAVEVRSGRAGA